jgi:hypothetical protein
LRTGLVVGGAVTLGTLWVITAVAGGLMNWIEHGVGQCGLCKPPDDARGLWLIAPVIGPFGELSHSQTVGESAVLVVDGALQVASAAMLISGLTIPRMVLVRDGGTLSLAPVSFLGRSQAGLGVVGRF